jgi:ESCRT-II complex subunit VPS25
MSSSFIFPDYYNWPFFFTIQKNFDTKIKQFGMWITIIKDYCKVNKIWRLSKSFFIENLSINKNINRRLTLEGVDTLFNYMRDIAKCLIEITKEDYYILWKSLDEWEQCFYDSVNKHHRIDSLETLDYLISDEEVKNEEFYGMDYDLLIRILLSLQKKGKCILISSDQGNYVGVKFIKN